MMWPGARRGRDSERRLSRVRYAALLLAAPVFSYVHTACYTADNGKDPPKSALYYPTGMVVSPGGNALFVANSDFDLQYKGGTLQSYDLFAIRKAALDQLKNPPPGCPDAPNVTNPDSGARIPPGQTCAPPVDSAQFVRDSVLIGAFTADMIRSTKAYPSTVSGGLAYRLFLPVRGDATLTWADIVPDLNLPPNEIPTADAPYFKIDCGAPATGERRCNDVHQAGRSTDPGNPGPTETTDAGVKPDTLPGEPFGVAQSGDGRYIVVSHQTEAKVTLFDTGLRPASSTGQGLRADEGDAAPASDLVYDRPSLKFILDDPNLKVGGTGVAYVPEDPRAYPTSVKPLAPAFYSTNRSAPQLSLFRVFPDDTKLGDDSRPTLVRESVAAITINASGVDSRDIVLDPSPRIVCEKQLRFDNEKLPTPKSEAELAPQLASCARRPARVFITNRSPASLLVGELGDGALGTDGSYNGTRITLQATIPLAAGPSRLFVAPIVDDSGLYALRVFIVCFDSRTVFVINPDRNSLENIIRTADGPFALAFDPFDLGDVIDKRVRKIEVDWDERYDSVKDAHEMRRYRFAYLASFTRSYVQVIDLDNSRPDKSTFETVVYSMGLPTKPVGSK
jgi:hypothetical protein